MADMIIRFGAVCGAITAAIILARYVVSLIRLLKSFSDKLDAIQDDIADLQYERLSQAHDFYMDRGWCPSSKKQMLCQMHKSYAEKGRNHLSKYYENEILGLPDSPQN